MPAGVTIRVQLEGADEMRRAFDRLASESPARARLAVNRTLGVVRKRVIRYVAGATGVSQRILGGPRGRGYIKQIKASRRARGAIVALVEGVRFSNLGRSRLGRSRRKPGGTGQPFHATMRSGHASLFERRPPLVRTSPGGGRRRNLPIREVVVPLQPHAGRAIRVHMKRATRTVYPAKLWEEIQKSIKPAK